ncbi:MAG TPA: PAS domain-containing protein, partial [Ilumatobacteraceae bacterium]|nr:PAS domain-containing protein [Ilumatobacteraceae bacterium]
MVVDDGIAATKAGPLLRASATTSRWIAVAVAVVAAVALDVIEAVRSGTLAGSGRGLTDVSELVLPVLATALFVARWRNGRRAAALSLAVEPDMTSEADARDELIESGVGPRFDDTVVGTSAIAVARASRHRADGWLWLAAASLSWALGHLLWVVIAVTSDRDPSASAPSVLFVVTALATARGLVKICGLTRAWPVVRPLVGDAAILAFSMGFLVWELFLAPDVTDESTVTVLALAAVPLASTLVVAIGIVLLIDHRSLVVGAVTASAALLMIGDSALTAYFDNTSTTYASAHVLYLVAFALFAAAALLPHRLGRQPKRRSLARVSVVVVPAFVAIGVGVLRYMVLHSKGNVVSTVLIATTGLAWVFAEVSRWVEARAMARELDAQIDQVRLAQRDLRGLLDDLPEAVAVLSGDGRIVDVNGQALALTGRAHHEL